MITSGVIRSFRRSGRMLRSRFIGVGPLVSNAMVKPVRICMVWAEMRGGDHCRGAAKTYDRLHNHKL